MKIETKAIIGEEIYSMKNNKVVMSTVKHIKIEIREEPTQFGTKTVITITYQTANTTSLDESQIFITKQALLESL